MSPIVAIVGRPNVGKSALFNRIARKQISLVYDSPGVTRDRVSHDCVWQGHPFTLVDTGGIGLEDQSGFEEAIQREVDIAMETASDILLVVDGRDGLNPLDAAVASKLRRAQKKRIFLVVNKVDSGKQADAASEFYRLGFSKVFPISAAHGLGMDELMSALAENWTAGEAPPERSEVQFRVAMVGRPNVGKSSLLNALLKEDRVIVSPIAGTTRDAVDVEFSHYGQSYCFVDTAGMRKKGRIKDELEQAMTGRTAHTINRSHLCVLVVDALQGVSVQEKKIAGLIQDAGKPCVILVNKWDLVSKDALKQAKATNDQEFRKEYEEAVRRELFFVSYAPVLFISAETGKGLELWLQAMKKIRTTKMQALPTGILNRLIQKALTLQNPASNLGKSMKIYYVSAKKEDVEVPTLVVFINDKKLWTPDYQRYLERQVRAGFDLEGCPLQWVVKGKSEAQMSPKS